MKDLSLHILDIAENSISAGAKNIRIGITENTEKNLLTIEIHDDGKGMDDTMIQHATDPFYTTRTTRNVGLGIPLLAQAAQESRGGIDITTRKGEGTDITATFQHDHIDRKPLGDIAETMVVLIVGNPEIDFVYTHTRNDASYSLDTAELKKQLEDVPITTPDVIKIIKDDISEWLNSTKSIIVK